MKTSFITILLSLLIIMGLTKNVHSQVYYDNNCYASSTNYTSAIGKNCKAYGQYSFAGGWNSRAGKLENVSASQMAFAFGYNAIANGKCSISFGYETVTEYPGTAAIGYFVQSKGDQSFVFGSGRYSLPLINEQKGIMFGVNSPLPTMFISAAPSQYYTGKVAIGNTTAPAAKLHIKGDNIEDADLLLEPTQDNSASIMFRNKECFIKVEKSGKMSITVPSKPIVFNASKYCFGSERIYMKNEGTDGFSVSVPETMSMGASEFRLSGNEAIGMNAQKITLNGKVGINVENYQDNYALAVNGGIITTEVYIAEADNWPDHVFADDYKLMGLHELENFIRANRHLPDVPSEDEVLENGYDMGEMQQTLLKKVEELTLYTIQLQKQIERQQKEIDELKAK